MLLLLARVYDHLALGGVAGWVEQREEAARKYLNVEEEGIKEAGEGENGDEWDGLRGVVEGVRRAVLAEVVGKGDER